MPELPEVEVVRRGLATHLVGAIIDEIRVHDARSVRRHLGGALDFQSRLEDHRIVDVARRGKYLWLLLQDEAGEPADVGLVIHLGMSGQVLLKTSASPHEKHLKVSMNLSNTTVEDVQLRFVDQRIFGGMFLDELVPTLDAQNKPIPAASRSETQSALIPQSVAHIARDPLDPYFSLALLRRKMINTSSGIKRLLLDQSVISGVGNIYADEALWTVRLHYAKPAKSISASKTKELVDAVQNVMQNALAVGGTSFDALYVNVNGESGYFDRSLHAYGQAGKPCERCIEKGFTSIMVREPFMNRSSFRCPRCQRTPRQS